MIKKSKQILSDKSGVTLLLTMVIIAVVFIVGASVMFAASSALSDNTDARERQQAYLNAKSAAVMFTEEFTKALAVEKTAGGLKEFTANDSTFGELLKDILVFREKTPGFATINATVPELNATVTIKFTAAVGYDFKVTFSSKAGNKTGTIVGDYKCQAENKGSDGIHYSYILLGYNSK